MNTVSVTDLRQNATTILNSVVASQNPVYIIQNSKAKVVMLDASYYLALREVIEDYEDILDSRKALIEGVFVPFEKVHANISRKTSKKRS
ncbi:MAG: type II toxin-antitoxin system Phd/YefM family antitoxin [Patescibacteria group bacterium]